MTGRSVTKRKTGPKPNTVKIDGDWREAIKKALGKKRPERGWPEPKRKKRKG